MWGHQIWYHKLLDILSHSLNCNNQDRNLRVRETFGAKRSKVSVLWRTKRFKGLINPQCDQILIIYWKFYIFHFRFCRKWITGTFWSFIILIPLLINITSLWNWRVAENSSRIWYLEMPSLRALRARWCFSCSALYSIYTGSGLCTE